MEYEDYAGFGMKADYSYKLIAKVHNTKNLIFDMTECYIKDVRKGMVIEFVFNDVFYYMMSLQKFKIIIGG